LGGWERPVGNGRTHGHTFGEGGRRDVRSRGKGRSLGGTISLKCGDKGSEERGPFPLGKRVKKKTPLRFPGGVFHFQARYNSCPQENVFPWRPNLGGVKRERTRRQTYTPQKSLRKATGFGGKNWRENGPVVPSEDQRVRQNEKSSAASRLGNFKVQKGRGKGAKEEW